MTGSSSSPLKVIPACAASTSMACVSSTESTVPIGTVTDAGATAGSGGGGGGVLRAVNSTAAMSAIGTSVTEPSASIIRTLLTSALMNDPSTNLPDRSFTRSAESVAAPIVAIAATATSA